MCVSKEDSTEFSEQGPLERLGKEVRQHRRGVTVCELKVVSAEAIGDPKMTNVNVARVGSCGRFSIFNEFDCAFVVLVY